jgi:hypothetical protein
MLLINKTQVKLKAQANSGHFRASLNKNAQQKLQYYPN